MRKIAAAGITAMFLVTAACQPADQGMNTPNNTTDFQQTRFGETDTNNFNRNNTGFGNNTGTGMNDGGFGNRTGTGMNDGGFGNRDNTGWNNRTGMGDRTGFNDTNRMNNANNNQDYQVADRAADRITDQIDEVQRAHVLAGNNNAYVAVVMDREENRNNNGNNNTNRNRTDDYEIDDDLKERVADIVRSTDRNIENVYVSANPDFLQMVDSYVDDVQAGRPIQGFFEEFNTLLDRIFPNLER